MIIFPSKILTKVFVDLLIHTNPFVDRFLSYLINKWACRSYMGRIERGEVNITVEKLYRIAAELGCKPADLLPPAKVPDIS